MGTIKITPNADYDADDPSTVTPFDAGVAEGPASHSYTLGLSSGFYFIRDNTVTGFSYLGSDSTLATRYSLYDGIFADFSANRGRVSLTGGARGDVLLGGSNDDLIRGGLGANRIDGGAGTNTLSYDDFDDHANDGVQVVLDLFGSGSGVASTTSSDTSVLNDTITNIQNVRGSAFDDTITGDGNRNVIEGGGGKDTIFGGGGGDFVGYQHARQGVTVDLGVARGAAQSSAGTDADGDVLYDIENLVGSSQADTLTGDRRSNQLLGGGGADTISALGGNDTVAISLTSTSFNATPTLVDGGDGYDTLIVQQNSFVALNEGNFANFERVRVNNGGTLNMSGVSRFDFTVFSDSSAGSGVSITGTALTDRIVGGAGNDTITGAAGDDYITAGSGHDTFDEMMAGFGRDRFTGVDLTKDTFALSTGFAADNTAAHLHFAAFGAADTLVYGDAGKGASADVMVLKGIATATAEAHRDAFTVSPQQP